ncbi:MAG: alanine--tRNA ligase [Bacteroidales bacterium]|jgi:alanyl-tRNA synthetase
MTSNEIRKAFLDFFQSKQHRILLSAPMVVKNDPTLMFTNAGMNQFKDIFLDNTQAKHSRITNTQKCLRVSGKHNDLEEVGIDTYHHTMFEMLGNWSFGDYFKKEAIEWAWELLTKIYKLDEEKLYVTIFAGDEKEDLPKDDEAFNYWKKIISEDKILLGNKKDNFWEMGDIGPCGPCSEIHIDLRDESERKKIDGSKLVNTGHPQVIEIWNLVFIQYNRLADGSLKLLPNKHVDTGMGFERLCMAIQNKKSNYDTDVFQPLIQNVANISGKEYGKNQKHDVAMRVAADHIRAISFAIAEGQLPSNNKAGYVIRRILRRAIRYGYSYLDLKEPFLFELVSPLTTQMGDMFPELISQKTLIKKVIKEEETAFLRTLSNGIQKFENYISSIKSKEIKGDFAFELFDTYGFPVDLTQLMAKENNLSVDMKGFNKFMEEQKTRSRQSAAVETEDWIELKKEQNVEFVGYDFLECNAEIVKYRKIKTKEKEQYQIVLNKTPFYAESGGQAGDSGFLVSDDEKISVINTLKENDLIIHISEKLPKDVTKTFLVKVDKHKRTLTENNHTATHLLHAALKKVLGTHVEQKGSLVDNERLRFDFSHFSKLTNEEILKVEKIVNEKIRENILLEEFRNITIQKAKGMGAVALFGEKYGDSVRAVAFDKKYSVELCGGTHVRSTGQIGLFKIISESAVAAGVRRIEAITAEKAEEFYNSKIQLLEEISEILKNPKDLSKAIRDLQEQNNNLQKQITELNKEKIKLLKTELTGKIENINELNFISAKLNFDNNFIKDLAFDLKNNIQNLFFIIGSEFDGKVNLTLIISENIVKDKNLNASQIIRELAKEIDGGGGGQTFFATAGGKNIEGIEKALNKAKEIVENLK